MAEILITFWTVYLWVTCHWPKICKNTNDRRVLELRTERRSWGRKWRSQIPSWFQTIPPPQPNHPPTKHPITVEPVGVLVKQSQTQQVVDWLKVGGGGGSTGVWVIPTHHELLNTCALYNDFFKARESVLFFMLVPVLLYKIDVTVIVRIRIGLRVLAKSAQSESWFTIRRTKNCYNCLRKAGTFRNFLMLLSL